jgi:hypothetical protein
MKYRLHYLKLSGSAVAKRLSLLSLSVSSKNNFFPQAL